MQVTYDDLHMNIQGIVASLPRKGYPLDGGTPYSKPGSMRGGHFKNVVLVMARATHRLFLPQLSEHGSGFPFALLTPEH